MGWFAHLRSSGKDPGCQVALVLEAPFTWQLPSWGWGAGHHSQNFHNCCPGVGPSGTPPGSQAMVQEMRSLTRKADKLPASVCQKTKQPLSNICVHCEEIYSEKEKRGQADIPGSVVFKVIPFVAIKESQDAL